VRAWVQLVAADITDLATVLAGYLTKNNPSWTGTMDGGSGATFRMSSLQGGLGNDFVCADMIGFIRKVTPSQALTNMQGMSLALKGAVNGVAELGADGRVPTTQLPPYLALGETSATAYRGDRGKIAYNHSQTTGNPHGTTAADVGAFPAWFAVGGIDFNALGQGVWSLRTGPASNGWAGLTSLQNVGLIEVHGADNLRAQIAADMRFGGLLTRSQMSEFGNAWSGWASIWDSFSLPVGTTGRNVLAAASQSAARFAIAAAGSAGVTNGSNAGPGVVGQYIEALLPEASRVYASNGAPISILSLDLPAGDWLVEGRATAFITGAMAGNAVISGLNTSVAIPTDGTEVYGGMQVFSSTNGFQTMTGSKRFSLSSDTTIHLVGQINFNSGTPAFFGCMHARRMR
jgi:hypothetical protein